jgi:hypothetical protein
LNDFNLDYGACGPKTKNGLIQFYPDLFAEEDFLLNIDTKFKKINILFNDINTQKFDPIIQELIKLFQHATLFQLINFSCYDNFPTEKAFNYRYLRDFLKENIFQNKEEIYEQDG